MNSSTVAEGSAPKRRRKQMEGWSWEWHESDFTQWWFELRDLWNSRGFKGYLSKWVDEGLRANDGPKELIQSGYIPETNDAVPGIGSLTVWDQ